MICKKVGRNTKLRHSTKKSLIGHLTVLDNESMKTIWIMFHHIFNCINNKLRCLISIRVDMNLDTVLYRLYKDLKKQLLVDVPKPVWCTIEVPRGPDSGRKPLNRSIHDKLNFAKSHFLR